MATVTPEAEHTFRPSIDVGTQTIDAVVTSVVLIEDENLIASAQHVAARWQRQDIELRIKYLSLSLCTGGTR